MRKRSLSEFMCIEMLYDYKTGKLDPLRAQAVEECLQGSPRVREELKKLSHGLSYCDKLKVVKVSQPLIDIIANHPKPSQKALQHLSWKALPQPIRWGIEGVIVSVALVLFVFQYEKLFKSDKVKESSVVYKKFDLQENEEIPTRLDEIPTEHIAKEAPRVAEIPPPTVTEKSVAPVVVAETKVPAKGETIIAPVQIEARKVVAEKPLILAASEFDQSSQIEIKPIENPAVVAQNTKPQANIDETMTTTTKKEAKKGNAYVYRMVMYVENVEKVTPEIIQFMKTLGAQKAGEVELGWRRKGGSYFHFTIPQINNQTLQDGLKKYSQFNMVKSSHPRVMPEGTERFILWVEEKKAGEELPAGSTMPTMEGQPTDGTEAP